MKKTFFTIALVFLLVMPCSADPTDDQALAAAETFTAIIDSNNLQAAYWAGSPLLQLANDEQDWINRIARSSRVMGEVFSRKLVRIRAVARQAELPDDDYRLIHFEARTELKEKAAEVILSHRVEGIWQVCRYSIR